MMYRYGMGYGVLWVIVCLVVAGLVVVALVKYLRK